MLKKKILLISDHLMMNSGVAVQSKHLVDGLINTGKYKFIQIGAAKSHLDYSPVKVNEDLIIIPFQGFGNKDVIRSLLVTEKPDAMIIFNDPRFFDKVFEIEDEIHQICPILYWHVWDNRPFPEFNRHIYESTDMINCISYLTHNVLKYKYDNKVSYIPHSLPQSLFFKLQNEEKLSYKERILGKDKVNNFTCLWINRNTRRKRPADLLKAWQIFLFNLKEKFGHNNATLIMHTDPEDSQGSNLFEIAKMLKIKDSVCFSTEPIDFREINILHNISDVCINISYAEGFGLSTLESMQVGNPIIAVKTGGQTRQIINHFDGSINGIALEPDMTTISGSQKVHYLNEDYVKTENVAKAILEMYNLGEEKRNEIGKKAMEYVKKEFNYNNMISLWDNSLEETIKNWKNDYKRIRISKIGE